MKKTILSLLTLLLVTPIWAQNTLRATIKDRENNELYILTMLTPVLMILTPLLGDVEKQ